MKKQYMVLRRFDGDRDFFAVGTDDDGGVAFFASIKSADRAARRELDGYGGEYTIVSVPRSTIEIAA
jgi:hypothetical protein